MEEGGTPPPAFIPCVANAKSTRTLHEVIDFDENSMIFMEIDTIHVTMALLRKLRTIVSETRRRGVAASFGSSCGLGPVMRTFETELAPGAVVPAGRGRAP